MIDDGGVKLKPPGAEGGAIPGSEVGGVFNGPPGLMLIVCGAPGNIGPSGPPTDGIPGKPGIAGITPGPTVTGGAFTPGPASVLVVTAATVADGVALGTGGGANAVGGGVTGFVKSGIDGPKVDGTTTVEVGVAPGVGDGVVTTS